MFFKWESPYKISYFLNWNILLVAETDLKLMMKKWAKSMFLFLRSGLLKFLESTHCKTSELPQIRKKTLGSNNNKSSPRAILMKSPGFEDWAPCHFELKLIIKQRTSVVMKRAVSTIRYNLATNFSHLSFFVKWFSALRKSYCNS